MSGLEKEEGLGSSLSGRADLLNGLSLRDASPDGVLGQKTRLAAA